MSDIRMTAREVEELSLTAALMKIDVTIAETRAQLGEGAGLFAIAALMDQGLLVLKHRVTGRRVTSEELLAAKVIGPELQATIAPIASGTKRGYREGIRVDILKRWAAMARVQAKEQEAANTRAALAAQAADDRRRKAS